MTHGKQEHAGVRAVPRQVTETAPEAHPTPAFNEAETSPVEVRDRLAWTRSPGLVDYAQALAIMDDRARRIAAGDAAELIWLLEHPPLVTAGTSARTEDLLQPSRFPVHQSGRGGQFTYHGPGQRIAYVMLDVRRRFAGDVRRLVRALEDVGLDTLQQAGIAAERRPGHPGLYVRRHSQSEVRFAKIAALGLRVRAGVSMHGLSINVCPDLDHYRAIVACGDAETPATSLAAEGSPLLLKDVDKCLLEAFARFIGPLRPVASVLEGG